jgi:hypothetical protein
MKIIRTGAKVINGVLPAVNPFFRTFAAMVVRIWPVIVVVTVSWLLLFFTEQGHDLLAGARGDFWQACRLYVAVYFVSALAAFCTVYLLNLPPDWDSGRIFKHISVWDRKLGLTASLPRSSIEAGTLARIVMIFFAASWAGTFLLENVSLYLFGSSFGSFLLQLLLFLLGAVFVYVAAFLLILSKPVRPFRNASSLFCVSCLLIFAFFPVPTGLFLGSEFTFFLALSLWLLLACALVGHLSILGLEAWQAIIAIFALAWMVGGISDWFREAAPPATLIRCIDHPCKPPRQALVKLDDAFIAWLAQQRTERPALVLVSAAGGGARASYWSSIVLGRLGDKNRVALRQHLFLASGVSGGALGIAVHASLLATENLPCADKRGPLEDCARQFGKGDFLAPNIAAFLTADLLNVALPRFISFSGRDVALEQAWENRWKLTVGTSALSESFVSLWRVKNAPVPNLILNATSTRTGDRIVISNIAAASIDARFNLAEKVDLPLSAAINASARFPFVDPPGAVRISEKPNETQWEVIADGGYYDNFGAATLLDVLDKLEQYAKRQRTTLDKLVKPVVLQITSDPTRGMAQTMDAAFHGDDFDKLEDCKSRRAPITANDPPSWWQWALSSDMKRNLELIEKRMRPGDPLKPAGIYGTLMKARTRSGSVFPNELRKRIYGLGGQYFHIAMDDSVSAPLGWALSERARNNLDTLLDSKCHSIQLDQIVELLRDQ